MMEDAVSEFIVSSCIVYPQPNQNRVDGLFHLFDGSANKDVEKIGQVVNTLTGSASEFFIDPMLRCCNDTDIMSYGMATLAVPTKDHMPRYVQLPVECSRMQVMKLFEFVDIQIPCYVFIRFIGELRKSESDDSYTFVHATGEYQYIELPLTLLEERHGPANMNTNAHYRTRTIAGRQITETFSLDTVQCVHCLEWPPQSMEWLTRVRQYNCPDAATIQGVVGLGCDLVSTVHRRYKQNTRHKRLMWRISFSRAETMLLNSWTAKQQILYHLLRYVTKKAGFIEKSAHASTEQSEQSTNGIFHNYHLKTMMLWSCEQQSPQWWSLSLVRILTKLMHFLSRSLSYGECQHYFIINCNLLDYLDEFDSSTVEDVKSILTKVTDESISMWLVNTYIRECAQQCPDHVSSLMDNIGTTTELQHALRAIIDWRKIESMVQSAQGFLGATTMCESRIYGSNLIHYLTYARFVDEIRQSDERLAELCTSLIFLHLTKLIYQNCNFFNIIEAVRQLLESEDPRYKLMTSNSSTPSTYLLTHGINLLMKLGTIDELPDTMLRVELAKAFFTESINNSTRNHQQHVQCLARINLASLYYRTEQYQTAINQCLLVTKQCDDQRGPQQFIDMQHLSNSDDDISIVSGLIALYQFIIQTTSSNQYQHTRHIRLVAAESYSLSMMIKCLSRLKSVDRKFTKNILCRYKASLLNSQSLSIADVLLLIVSVLKKQAMAHVVIYTRRSIREPTETQSSRMNTVRLHCSLMKSAVERLTRMRQAMSRDYIFMLTTVTTDYEAMYAYKCGEYEKCLHLCEQNVNKLQFINNYTPVCEVPASDLFLLMDDDCLSLVGITRRLFEPCVTAGAFERAKIGFSHVVFQTTISLYLLVQCKLQLRHSTTSLAAVLRLVQRYYRKRSEDLSVEFYTERLILAFVYRKALRTMRSSQVHRLTDINNLTRSISK